MTSLQKDFNHFIYGLIGGEDLVALIKKEIPISKLIANNMVEPRSNLQLDQKEAMRFNAEQYAKLFKLTRELSDPNKIFRDTDFITTTFGFMLNTGAFLSTIQLLGNQEQVKFWQGQVLGGKAIGGYGQTEVGHGSDVKGLQTTATFNEAKRIWTINSPTITSGKYWPGLLGHYSTHVVVQAKTFVKGQNLGNQTFVVQIRNKKLEDVPNVQAFDIGPKLGFDKVDNGGIFFRNLQVPRNAMLMKYVIVEEDGTVKGLQNLSAMKYSYGSMVNLRIRLTYLFGMFSIVMPTLYLYQTLKDMGVQKQLQHRKFMTEKLCLGYGIILSNANTVSFYHAFNKQIVAQNYDKADKLLVTIHIMSATFKAVSSRLGIDTNSSILTYSQLSKFKTTGIPGIFLSYIPSATYQGDNLVMLQQTSKYLLAKFGNNKQVSGLKKGFKSNDWESAVKAFQHLILNRVSAIKQRMEDYSQKNIPYQTAWNQKQQLNLIQASILWGYMTFLKNLTTVLPTIKKNHQFYRKICEEFTNFIVKRAINDLFLEDFSVEFVQTWQNFSEDEFLALAQINYPIERKPESVKFIPRDGGRWLNAKL